jgi:hypothetical protein
VKRPSLCVSGELHSEIDSREPVRQPDHRQERGVRHELGVPTIDTYGSQTATPAQVTPQPYIDHTI